MKPLRRRTDLGGVRQLLGLMNSSLSGDAAQSARALSAELLKRLGGEDARHAANTRN